MKWKTFLQPSHSINQLLIKGSKNLSGLRVKIGKPALRQRLRNESVR